MTNLDSLAGAKYLSLTTYRKDGTAVPTPVWLVRQGETLRVITQGKSGKVKRIRNNPAVLVAPCDSRGRLKGEQVRATATLLDEKQTQATAELITRRYGLLGRILMWRNERQARRTGQSTAAGISISLD
jgi:uncharacterized protein